MKKVLVCALAALFLMASCLTAFATPAYVTTTSYVTEDGVTSLNVKTVVTGAEDDTMLTYLAYTGEAATDETVVFIDQKTADGEPVEFNYTTAESNLTGVTVKFGTSDEDEAYPITEAEAARIRVINVAVVDGGNDSIVLPTATSTGVYATDITVPSGYELVSAVIGETNVASLIDIASGVVKVTDAAALVNGATITITLEEPYSYDPEVTETVAGHYNGYDAGDPAEKMTVFGKADTDIAVNAGDWGGMILSENADFDIDTVGVQIFPAKYRGENGEFAVQLINKGDKELTNRTWYARVYVKSTTGIAYGPVHEFEAIEAE